MGKASRSPMWRRTRRCSTISGCAGRYAERGIYLNSVDPGWVSNEAPAPRIEEMERAGFREPLDLTDAAARVLDPVFTTIETGRPEFGKLFKDYRPAAW